MQLFELILNGAFTYLYCPGIVCGSLGLPSLYRGKSPEMHKGGWPMIEQSLIRRGLRVEVLCGGRARMKEPRGQLC